jgi:hypothetical protein
LQAAVDGFVKKHSWGVQSWKEQPEIAVLFRLASKEQAP